MLDYNVSYRNKDKSIQCIISYKDNDGKWRQKSKQGFKTQKESKPWVKSAVKELKKTIKTPAEYRGMTFGEFKDIFKNDKENEYAYNTLEKYRRACANFKGLNNIALSEVGYIHLKPCVDGMIRNNYSNSTVTHYLTLIKAIFNHAINNYQIITDNPVDTSQYVLPKEEKKDKIKALNESEARDLLSKISGNDYYISLIACKCGLRIGEIIGLTTDCFDFKKNEIKIYQQWKLLDKDEYGFGTLKTYNSYRTVPIPVKYSSQLSNYVNTCVKDINKRVFIDGSTKNVSVRLSRKFKRLGYGISVHDLRHTYITTLLFNGLDYKTVSELAGDTVQTIINTYSHFIEDMRSNARERINKIL